MINALKITGNCCLPIKCSLTLTLVQIFATSGTSNSHHDLSSLQAVAIYNEQMTYLQTINSILTIVL